MARSNFGDKIVLGGGMIAIGCWIIWSAIKRHRRVREIEDQPTSKVAFAAQGLSELQGFAWSQFTGVRNFSGDELVYYHFKLQKQVIEGSGKNRRTKWSTVYYREYAKPFFLVDSTGLAIVDPANADLEFYRPRMRAWSELSVAEQTHFHSQIVASPVAGFPPNQGFWGGLLAPKFRVVETQVKLGAPLFVTGIFVSNEVDSASLKLPGLSKFAAEVFNESSGTFRDLKSLLDKNRNGTVSDEEMLEGYANFAKAALEQARQTDAEEREFKVHGAVRSTSEHKMLVSDAHQNHLLKRLSPWVLGQLLLGVAFATAGVALMFSNL